MDLKSQVANMLSRIENGDLSERELDNLYDNAEKHPQLDETDREIILDALMKRLWQRFPRAAKSRFGNREEFASNLLTPVLKATMETYDGLRKNKVLNKVKIGGEMRRKDGAFIDIYISYKNAANRRLSLVVWQKSADSLPICSVRDVFVGSGDDEKVTDFSIDDFQAAAASYTSKLGEMLR